MGVLRATPSRLVLLRSWKVDLKRISFRLDGSAGVTYQGDRQPDRLHTCERASITAAPDGSGRPPLPEAQSI